MNIARLPTGPAGPIIGVLLLLVVQLRLDCLAFAA
jgi:hypothetical protein